jgi:hypothetical protein
VGEPVCSSLQARRLRLENLRQLNTMSWDRILGVGAAWLGL